MDPGWWSSWQVIGIRWWTTNNVKRGFVCHDRTPGTTSRSAASANAASGRSRLVNAVRSRSVAAVGSHRSACLDSGLRIRAGTETRRTRRKKAGATSDWSVGISPALPDRNLRRAATMTPPTDSTTESPRANRLARETSPYLLQHAHNPVDWFPWGDEAFSTARREDKPVLLSIGYSACHWCHVMERESFENPQIAELMNRLFVNVKVDREERPDVDAIYMAAIQALTGHGGWPMT